MEIRTMSRRLVGSAAENRPLVTITAIFLGAFLTSFHARLFSAGLTDLRGQLGLDIAEGAWLSTALNASQLLTAPFIPWLATAIGPTRTIVLPSILLGISSLLIPFATQFSTLLILHIVSGLCLGVYLSLTISLSLKSLRPQYWMIVFAIYGLRLSFGLNAGFNVSGILIEDDLWEWIYWTTAATAPVVAIMIWKSVPITPVNWDDLRSGDWPGMTAFCLGLALLYVGIDNGERLGWTDSGLVAGCLVGSAGLLSAWLANLKIRAKPFGDPVALDTYNGRIIMVIGALFGVLMLPDVMLVPGFLAQMGGLKPIQVGTSILMVVGIHILAIPPSVYLARRLDTRIILTMGLIAMAVSAWLGTGIDNQWRADQFIGVLLLSGVGQCFTFLGIIVISVINTNPKYAVSMLVYIPVIRILLPMVGGAIMGVWLRVGAAFHGSALSDRVQSGEPIVVDRMANGSSEIAQIVAREAQVLAYIDAFHIIFWAAIVTLVLAMTLRAPSPNPVAPLFLPKPAQ